MIALTPMRLFSGVSSEIRRKALVGGGLKAVSDFDACLSSCVRVAYVFLLGWTLFGLMFWVSPLYLKFVGLGPVVVVSSMGF